MNDEKQFGHSIEDNDIFSADDLLRLQPNDRWGIEFDRCTLCSKTCDSATSVVE